MKTLKYILFFVLAAGLFSSCLVNEETDLDLNGQGPSLVTFDGTGLVNLTVLANGAEYDKTIKVLLVGPTKNSISGDLTVTFAAMEGSTAIEGVHYTMEKTMVLKESNNYLGYLNIKLLTDGNAPPMEDSPEYEDYKAPVLYLKVTNVTGANGVIASGKEATVNLNFTPPNPYALTYDSELYYWHPSAGGDYPPSPNGEPYGGVRHNDKELVAVTGRKCQTNFSIWEDLCWITVNSDNSIDFVVDVTWPYDVKLGDPNDPSKVSRFDPDTGIIYLYYYYTGDGGDRIFWEKLTPIN